MRGDRLDGQPDRRVEGAFAALLPVGAGRSRVQAWAHSSGAPIAEAVLLDAAGVVCGELAVGSARPDVARRYGALRRYCGICGYAFAAPVRGDLRVRVRLRGEPRFSPLPGRHSFGLQVADAAR